MRKIDLGELYFSQLALATYQTCPLKFRRRYMDGLYWPQIQDGDVPAADFDRGRLFHLLAQRYFTSPDGSLLAGIAVDAELSAWLALLKEYLPLSGDCRYLPEQELRLAAKGVKLVAKYDLLVVHPDGRVIIYDWKTDRKPPGAGDARRRLQTAVYQYLLCATGGAGLCPGIVPEKVVMVYWNPRYPEKAERHDYNAAKCRGDGKWLRELIAGIKSCPYEAFHPTADEEACAMCEYRPLCRGRRPERLDPEDWDELPGELSWDSIQEMPFV